MRNLIALEAPDRPVDSVSMRDLLTPLFRHWRLLLVSFTVIFLIVLAFLMTRPKEYQSHLEVLVNRERVDPLVSAEVTTPSGGSAPPVTEEEINSEAELIRSQDLLATVVRDNRLQDPKNAKPGLLHWFFRPVPQSEAVRVDHAVTKLAETLKVKNVPKSNVIDVAYQSDNPQQTFGVLQSLGSRYIEKHIEVQRPPGAFDFFSREAARYKDGLNAAEEKLREFGGDGRLAAPDLQRSAIALQLAAAIGQAHTDEQQIAGDKLKIASDQAKLKTTSNRVRTLSVSNPPTMLIQQLGAEVLKARLKRSDLAAKYKPDYPLVVEADEEVNAATAAFLQAQQAQYVSETTDNDPTHEMMRQDLAKAESDLALQTGMLSATQASIQSMRGQMQELDGAVLKQGDLQREAKANEQNFLLYQSKREQERASDTLDRIHIGNVAIAVPPSLPAVPIPSRFPAPLLAFVIAAVLSLVLTYLSAYLNPAVHGPDELSELLGIPVVITIPQKRASWAA